MGILAAYYDTRATNCFLKEEQLRGFTQKGFWAAQYLPGSYQYIGVYPGRLGYRPNTDV
jgi:hypothetical protein